MRMLMVVGPGTIKKSSMYKTQQAQGLGATGTGATHPNFSSVDQESKDAPTHSITTTALFDWQNALSVLGWALT
jgi:hypothetical protein